MHWQRCLLVLERSTVQTETNSAQISWLACQLLALNFFVISTTICSRHAMFMVSFESGVVFIHDKERKKPCLPSKGHFRVVNHPIIWIKQVASHWENSLKWRSILALSCLWKLKSIFSLACWNFSNKVRLGRIWIIGRLNLRFTHFFTHGIPGRLVIMMMSGLRPWALSAEQSIPSVLESSF